jgi:hypothetical protein
MANAKASTKRIVDLEELFADSESGESMGDDESRFTDRGPKAKVERNWSRENLAAREVGAVSPILIRRVLISSNYVELKTLVPRLDMFGR